MNRTYSFWHLVVAFLFLIVLIISYCNKSFGQNKNTLIGSATVKAESLKDGYWGIPNDTTKPKVQYFLKLPYSQDQFRKKIDTIYQVSMLLGKSMTVDQSEQYKSLILSVLNNLSKDAKIDSIKIK